MWWDRHPKQNVIVITADGFADHRKLEVGSLCFASPDDCEAWEIDYLQQSKDERTGKLFQFVSILNKRPLRIYKSRPQSKSQPTRDIARQQFYEQLLLIRKKKERQSMMLWLGIVLVILAIILGMLVL